MFTNCLEIFVKQNNVKQVFDRRRLEELVKEVDPLEQLDDDVAEVFVLFASKY
jgi:hypothetical protein